MTIKDRLTLLKGGYTKKEIEALLEAESKVEEVKEEVTEVTELKEEAVKPVTYNDVMEALISEVKDLKNLSLFEATSYLKKYGIEFPEIQMREMVSRWGSCSPKKGFVTFNTALVTMPISCIEYVVTHEFTHFLYPNHSKKFYEQLATFMPDWEERKRRLENTPV